MKFMKKLLSAVTAAAVGVSMTTALAAGVSVASAADMTAVELVEDMGLGWNLGNALDCTNTWTKPLTPNAIETAWGNPTTTETMIKEIKKAGFKTVRIPVTWYQMMDSSGIISSDYLARVKEIVDYCVNNDMYAIINIHHDGVSGNWLSAGVSAKDKYVSTWEQIADYFKSYDEHLVFEGLNEVDISNADTMTLNQTFVDTVRASGGNNADRLLLVPAANNNTSKSLSSDFSAPTDSAKMVAVSVHYYEPTTFCVAPADSNWGYDADWGSASDYTTLENDFNKLESKFIDSGVPVIIGEYGVLTESKNGKDTESIHKFLKAVASTAYEKTGMCSVLWDTSRGGDMQFFDRETLSWFDGDVQAIFTDIANGENGDSNLEKTDRLTFTAEEIADPESTSGDLLIDLKPYKDLGITLSSVVINYTISGNKPAYGTGGAVQYNIVDGDGGYHWASQPYSFVIGESVTTVDIPATTVTEDEDGNQFEGPMDMDYLKIGHWYDWTDPSGGTVDWSYVDVTLIFDNFFYVEGGSSDTTTAATTTTTASAETTTTTQTTASQPVGEEIAQAYFIGMIGAASNWAAGENEGAAVTPIYGDGTYEIVWDVTGGGTDTVQFLAGLIEPTGDTENFTTDTFENLQVTLDEVWVDGVQLTDYAVSTKAINTRYYEGDGPGVTRMYLRDDWSTKIADLAGDTTITQAIKVVFTISGTGIEGGSTETTSETTTTTTEITSETTTTTTETETTTETTTTTTTGTTVSGDPNAFYGDINLDSRVDITDAVMLNKIAAGQVKPNDQQRLNADVNASGDLDNSDAIILLKFLVHLVNSLPAVD